MNNVDQLKLRRLLAEGEDARELQRSTQARYCEARAEQQLAEGRVFGRGPELRDTSLDELRTWDDDALWRVSVNRATVRAAIDARDYAEDLKARLDAVVAAAAPKVRLADRLRTYIDLNGLQA